MFIAIAVANGGCLARPTPIVPTMQGIESGSPSTPILEELAGSIVFVSADAETEIHDVFRVNLGAESPDPIRLTRAHADGHNRRLLADLDFEAQYPAWSSTGVIAFAGVQSGAFDIYTMRPDGSGLMNLTRDAWADNWPSFSPDGLLIAFFSERGGNPGIWVMAADGTGARRIADGGEPSWSPDGEYIVFNCGVEDDSAPICAIQPDGSGRVQLFDDTGFPAVRP